VYIGDGVTGAAVGLAVGDAVGAAVGAGVGAGVSCNAVNLISHSAPVISNVQSLSKTAYKVLTLLLYGTVIP
jgi:hypothetical protein